jgi:hypothetical protein
MHGLRFFLVFLLLGSCSAQTRGATRSESLYEQLSKKAASTQPPPELDGVRWMVGRWSVSITTYATPSAPQRKSARERTTEAELKGSWLVSRETDSSYETVEMLGYDPLQKTWVLSYFDSSGTFWGDPLTSRAGWQDGNLVLTGESTNVLGDTIELKLVITKISDNRYQVIHEERQANGEWLSIDEAQYTKEAEQPAHAGGLETAAGAGTASDSAPSSALEQTVLEREDLFDHAWLKADRDTLEQLIADDFVGVGSSLYTKAQVIAVAMRMEESATERTERNVRLFGNLAVARSLVTDRGVHRSSGQSYTATSRVTDIWVIRNGAWQLVAAQETSAKPSP